MKEYRWQVAAAFALVVVVAVAGQYAIARRSTDRLHRAQVVACERENGLRKEMNARARSELQTLAAFSRLLTVSAKDSPKTSPVNPDIAKAYEALVTQLAAVRYATLPLEDCG